MECKLPIKGGCILITFFMIGLIVGCFIAFNLKIDAIDLVSSTPWVAILTGLIGWPLLVAYCRYIW
jgi:hypothetical protein